MGLSSSRYGGYGGYQKYGGYGGYYGGGGYGIQSSSYNSYRFPMMNFHFSPWIPITSLGEALTVICIIMIFMLLYYSLVTRVSYGNGNIHGFSRRRYQPPSGQETLNGNAGQQLTLKVIEALEHKARINGYRI